MLLFICKPPPRYAERAWFKGGQAVGGGLSITRTPFLNAPPQGVQYAALVKAEAARK